MRVSGDATTVDVLVIGAGGAGLTAAISAATSGSSALVLEKCEKIGGSTGRSVGSFTAANTSYQYRAGVNDSTEFFIEDMKAANGEFEERENKELRRVLAENAGSTVEWLSSLGVQFLGPTPEPPYQKPRMHNVLPNSKAYIDALARECRRRHVRILTSCRVEKLLRNSAGEIIGARADGRDYLGRRGVILATGDYSAAADMKTAFVGEDAAKVQAVNEHSTGDGFRLGSDVGAVMLQMDRLYEGLRFPPARLPDPIKMLPSTPAISRLIRGVVEKLPKNLLAYVLRGALTSWVGPNNAMYAAGAVLVDSSGNRVANEDSDKNLARGIAAGGNCGYMIFDQRLAEEFSAWPNPVSTFPGVAYAYVQDYKRYRPDSYHASDTLEGLAQKIDVDTENLCRTIDGFREYASAGEDPDFGRTRFGAGIASGPYYALGPLRAYVTLADGGLMVDTHLQAVDGTATPIPGLWAAGSTGQGGLQLLNHGLHIGWAMVSGRIAGRNVAHSEARNDLAPVVDSDQSALAIPVERLNIVDERHFVGEE